MVEDVYTIDYKDLIKFLLKRHNIHEGIWGIHMEFKYGAAFAGAPPDGVLPATIIGINKVGIQRHKEETNISFDAAKLNPPAPAKTSKSKRAKHG